MCSHCFDSSFVWLVLFYFFMFLLFLCMFFILFLLIILCLFCFLFLSFCYFFFFFFFQAEDGIRDRDVTGVQTCALPIDSRSDAIGLAVSSACCSSSEGRRATSCSSTIRSTSTIATLQRPGKLPSSRSGERRVGEGRRGRWVGLGR